MKFFTPLVWAVSKTFKLDKEIPQEEPNEELTRWFSFESLDGGLGIDFNEKTLEEIAGPLDKLPKDFVLKYEGIEWIPVMKWLQLSDGHRIHMTSLRDIEGGK